MPIRNRNRGLRGQRFRHILIGLRKRHNRTIRRTLGIDELQNANHIALVVFHRHGEERLRTVSGFLIKNVRAGEIKIIFLGIRAGNVHGAGVNRGIGGNMGIVRCSIGALQRNFRKMNRATRTAAHCKIQRIGAQNLETQRRSIGIHAVQRAAVGLRNGFGG